MKRCTLCNNIMSDDSQKCSKCGRNLDVDFVYICNRCGQINNKVVGRCSKCNAVIPTCITQFNGKGLKGSIAAFVKDNKKMLCVFVGIVICIIISCQVNINNDRENKNKDAIVRNNLIQNVNSKEDAINDLQRDSKKKTSDVFPTLERIRSRDYEYYKPQSYLENKSEYPQIYGKQGVKFYIDLSDAEIDNIINLNDGNKIYQFSVTIISYDGISKHTRKMKTNVKVGDVVEPVIFDKGEWKKLEYFGYSAKAYNAGLLLADFFLRWAR